VFGKVTEGFDVVQKMATIPTKRMGRMSDIPVDPIVITKVTLYVLPALRARNHSTNSK
ncbi:peptidylprolyl isomerase, partial [Vibrio sp. 10N.286.46.E10]|uniref:peptidylprolyl isomerase n=1 Tax=Vibrio sp. 10N.286.46.E10 TaxID=1884477 RepID=UPI0015E63BE4